MNDFRKISKMLPFEKIVNLKEKGFSIAKVTINTVKKREYECLMGNSEYQLALEKAVEHNLGKELISSAANSLLRKKLLELKLSDAAKIAKDFDIKGAEYFPIAEDVFNYFLLVGKYSDAVDIAEEFYLYDWLIELKRFINLD